jgi:crotonobetainyl-CoA:carnitine CoA-transferase CaiB-like acyl-CoA transferase
MHESSQLKKTLGPLSGLRIVDVGSIFAGPVIGAQLGDLGADVIKIEPPNGDDVRRLGPLKNGVPLWWKLTARNKRLVSVDVSRPEGALVLERIVAQADVLVENFRPGKLESWGLDYARLSRVNPRLILLHISGYGSTGPYRNFPGFGTLAEAFSGFVYTNGQPDGPPSLAAFPIADLVTALYGTQSVLAALHERERSGIGQEIELSLYECMLGLMGNMVVNYDQLDEVMPRRGNRSKNSVPRNAYKTADERWVVVSSTTDSVARRLFRAIGRPDMADDPSLATNQLRAKRADEIDDVMSAWVAERTQAAALATLQKFEVAAGPINDIAQFCADPHVQSMQSLYEHLDPDLGMMRIPNVVPRFSRTPGEIRWTGRLDIGQDTREVLEEVGYSVAEIKQLTTDGVIVAPEATPVPVL